MASKYGKEFDEARARHARAEKELAAAKRGLALSESRLAAVDEFIAIEKENRRREKLEAENGGEKVDHGSGGIVLLRAA